MNYFDKQNVASLVLLCIAAFISLMVYQQIVDKLLDQNIQLGRFAYVSSLLLPTILLLCIIALVSSKKIQNTLMGGQGGVALILIGILVLASLYVYYLFIPLPSVNSKSSIGSWMIALHVFGLLSLVSGLLIYKTTRIFIESNVTLGKLAIVLVVLSCLFSMVMNKAIDLLSNNNVLEVVMIKIALIIIAITASVILIGLLNRIGLDWLLSVTSLVVMGLFLVYTSRGIRLLAIISLEGFFFVPVLFLATTSILLILWKAGHYLRSYLL